MRLTAFVLTVVVSLASASGTASAAPITLDPPTTGSYGWADNESRAFSLARVGSTYTLSVQGVGSSEYSSMTECCTDVFGRVLELFPGGTLHFTRLSLNTMPVQTEFWDDLNLTVLQRAGLDNLGTLTGLVTLDVPDGQVRGPRTLAFTGDFSEPLMAPMALPTRSVPEPSTMVLVGAGLLGLGRLLRRRR
jgi:hypothetical protein